MNDPRRNVPLPFLQGRRFPIIYLDLQNAQNACLEVLGQLWKLEGKLFSQT